MPWAILVKLRKNRKFYQGAAEDIALQSLVRTNFEISGAFGLVNERLKSVSSISLMLPSLKDAFFKLHAFQVFDAFKHITMPQCESKRHQNCFS